MLGMQLQVASARQYHRVPRVARGLLIMAVVGLAAAAATCGSAFLALPAAAPKAAKATLVGRAGLRAALSAPSGQAAAAATRLAARGGAAEGQSLAGKVALVTGATRGIGAAIAEQLAKAGAVVVGTATSDSGAAAISERLGAVGEGMKLDVTSAEDIDKVMEAITEKYGTPDILVNNAGITKDGLMMRMKEDAWDAVIDTNLNSIYRMTKAASKGMMKKRWGRVISISSVVGSMGNVGQSNYAAAKAGLEGFTRALAIEVASRGITVNAVAPGFIATDMTDGLKQEWKDKLLERVPAGRLGTPDEVADAVLYLASTTSSYVTGHTIHVNGGMYMA